MDKEEEMLLPVKTAKIDKKTQRIECRAMHYNESAEYDKKRFINIEKHSYIMLVD